MQSLLGLIFMVGIVMSNTVLPIDFAENVFFTAPEQTSLSSLGRVFV